MEKIFELNVKDVDDYMRPTFSVKGTIDPHGVITDDKTLFGGREVVKMTRGKFPFDSYLDMYEHSLTYHVIGGVKVEVVGFSYECINKSGADITKGYILVKKAIT